MAFFTNNTLNCGPDFSETEKLLNSQACVLFIADEALQLSLRCCFDDNGAMAGATSNTSEGLQLLRKNKYDCVLLQYDQDLPLFIEELKSQKTAIPVVVILPSGDDKLIAEVLRLGVSGYLFESQLNSAALKQTLVHALRLHQVEQNCRQAEEQFNTLQYQLEFVITNSPINAWSCDNTGAITYLKGDVFEQLGIDVQSAIGSHYADLYQDYPQIIDRFNEAMAGEQVEAISETKGRYYKACYVPMRDKQGQVTGVTGFAYDLTDQIIYEQEITRAKELAEESLRVKEQFIANISHELRTPLNGIVGLTGLIGKTPLNQEQQRYLKAIERSSFNLTHLINDLLDMAKITAHKIKFEQIEFNLHELVQETMDLMEAEAQSHHNVLSQHIASDVPPQLVGDSLRLKQILLNLIGNAVKFTNKGAISLSVRLLTSSGTEAWLEFKVEDNGIGIPPENLQAVFESFNQGSNDITRKFGGTGLGLSITKSLVELQGGRIIVKSKPKEGSTFTFTLPFKIQIPMDNDNKETNKNTLPQDQPFGQMRILLAEDNEINQLLVNTALKEWGCITDTVTNGKEALAKLKQSKYDLILMDMQMPVMDGYEAIIKIRQSGAHYAKIPIIALTAHATTAEVEECLATGADGYLCKPFEPEELHENIVRLTTEYRAHSK